MKPYYVVVSDILNRDQPMRILDAPSGNGWLNQLLKFETKVDGLDLFADTPVAGYHLFRAADLDEGIPTDLGQYEAIVCCEGIEHLGNPNLFFKSARDRLVPGGRFILTTPNIWYPAAKIRYLFRGFFPGFPCLVGNIKRGTHMHILPWSFPQLYLFLHLNGFKEITLHEIEEPKPKRLYERLFGLPQRLYCFRKRKQAKTAEEQRFWQHTGSKQSIFGRRLVVSAISP